MYVCSHTRVRQSCAGETAVVACACKVCQVQTSGANRLFVPEVRVTPAFILTYAKGQGEKTQERDLTSIHTVASR
jgi:hypothetical protein